MIESSPDQSSNPHGRLPPLRRKNSNIQQEFLLQALNKKPSSQSILGEESPQPAATEFNTQDQLEYNEQLSANSSRTDHSNREAQFYDGHPAQPSELSSTYRSLHEYDINLPSGRDEPQQGNVEHTMEYDYSLNHDEMETLKYQENEGHNSYENTTEAYNSSSVFSQERDPIDLNISESSNPARTYGQLAPVRNPPSIVLPSKEHLNKRARGFDWMRRFKDKSGVIETIIFVAEAILYDLPSDHLVAYFLVIFSMLSECFVPSPRHNMSVGCVLLFLPAESTLNRYYVTGLIFSILLDIFWLFRPNEISYEVSFSIKPAMLSQLFLFCCTCIKLWLVYSVYFQLRPRSPKRGEAKSQKRSHQSFLFNLVEDSKYFFPRRTLPPVEGLPKEVMKRSFVLLWIHIISGIFLLLFSLVGYVNYNRFLPLIASHYGLNLLEAMILKSSSLFILAAVASSKVNVYGFFSYYGCRVSLFKRPESLESPYIRYEKKWILSLHFLKAIDLVIGVYMAVVLYYALHQSSVLFVSNSNGVSMILLCTLILSLVVDLWSPLLFLIIVRCAKVLHTLHETEGSDVNAFVFLDSESEGEDSSDESSDESEEEDPDEDENEVVSGEDSELRDSSIHHDQYGCQWHEYEDYYGRSYYVYHDTGETFWTMSREPSLIPIGAPSMTNTCRLQSNIYLTSEVFFEQWEVLPVLTGFECRISTIPDFETLGTHLANKRFYIVYDGYNDDHVHYVYAYGTMRADPNILSDVTDTVYFFAEFTFDSLSLKMQVAFKCNVLQHESSLHYVTQFVQELRLRDIVGNYEPIEE